jgi:hypothetical protein
MIGDDLIPRDPHQKDRYADVDLEVRGRDYGGWVTGIARLELDSTELACSYRERVA